MQRKAHARTVWLTDDDEHRADAIIDSGLATTASEAVRIALALAVKVVDLISATMGVL